MYRISTLRIGRLRTSRYATTPCEHIAAATGVNMLEIKYDEIGRIPKILAKAIKKYGKR